MIIAENPKAVPNSTMKEQGAKVSRTAYIAALTRMIHNMTAEELEKVYRYSSMVYLRK